ncbi:phospholipase D [Crepidotus variabilis]|uniref:Phospholipase n=1 Tax=Crepidotus variabilis TaxID=179855 RepID=A0A9P6EEK5_9AGAR|nr:phospholipase D [Crepidotus variabilis]
MRRAFSLPHPNSDKEKEKEGSSDVHPRWARLRALLPQIVNPDQSILPGPSAVTSQAVNITDELITGGLSTLMLRLWFERDEKDHRRVPILLHRLRIRISDSLHPMQGHRSVFRVECEYANGAARWVVYRELRDFLSLHAHYTVSNVYKRNVDNMPEFPKTSLPYFKFLKKEGKEKGDNVGRADFARLQREGLENYLLDLIRAVMFHPSSNRLAGFLEISALSIALAQSGGAQYKAGYLQIEDTGIGGGGLGRKSAGWREKKEARWCSVRESYLVIMEEPGEASFTVIWDVFLLDSDFRIERPKRYYRQGFGLLDRGKHEAPTPMLDPSTNVNPIQEDAEDRDNAKNHEGMDLSEKEKMIRGKKGKIASAKKKISGDVSRHTFYIINSQMRLKIFAKNERQMLQFITALEKTAATSHYTGSNRFDSFAPIRLNVSAQWLVDGRDYFWNLSRAILYARESIYIHDWWLSPELLMRRPNKDRYRLDRLLERKAKEGVKIYVILYQEVSNKTTPTDSNYAKQRLTSLHPNVMVQRSPSHFQTGTFYWAHHEKMCVIDQTIAFMGGVDLCFGRWDTAQHVLTDDIGEEAERSEVWPGKDYSNPRMSDFHTLNKPEEDMYDRAKVPRMPWHDVGMQVVGQPARDLARHFVQRWNYLLRIKNHTRVMPFLLPPPEFRPGELTQLGLTGTCELQICRSAGPWSLGTPGRIEHSIQNAYLKAIQMSEHFVYIENQFFITSTVVNDVKVENNIGDAIVHRIIKAHRDSTPWKCCIVIPVLPGFTFPVDHSDASAIRIILECQNRTIARGPNSIFSRLRKEGIDPDDYISIFSLRNWAKLRGDVLTTEQVYIHGKVCIVDDRLAIIGSANINERSQRGDRDSELAAVIRDTDLIDSTMAGKPFKVGRFAHTLRVRLMREHLGIDVDALDEEDLMANEPVKEVYDQETWDPDREQAFGKESGVTHVKKSNQKTPLGDLVSAGTDALNQAVHAGGETMSSKVSGTLRKIGVVHTTIAQNPGDKTLTDERKDFNKDGKKETGFASSVVPTLEEKTVLEQRPPNNQIDKENDRGVIETEKQDETPGLTDHSSQHDSDTPSAESSRTAVRTGDNVLYGAPANASHPDRDDAPPIRSSKADQTDDEEHAAPEARAKIRGTLKSGKRHPWTVPTKKPNVGPDDFEDPICDEFWKNIWVASAAHNTEIFRKVFHAVPDDLITTWKQYKEFVAYHERLNKPATDNGPEPVARVPSEAGDEGAPTTQPSDMNSEVSREGEDLPTSPPPSAAAASSTTHPEEHQQQSKARRPAKGAEPFEKWEREEMEQLLGELNGHLILYSNRFLEGEDIANNFLFNADRMLPLPIYL